MEKFAEFRQGDEVREALWRGKPVLALESTVITHGLPYPENLEAARRLEQATRDSGAVPATIAILEGSVHVGLSDAQIEALSQSTDAKKLNLSNLAAGIASGQPGSTTVAATMFIAARAGLRVFATGGIGGVHREAERTFDISADLSALARFPVAVVSAGAKAILDLPRTVELLETLGVPVYGWRTNEFPAFYRRESGLPVDARFDDAAALARAVALHWGIGFSSGVLVGNPVPEEHELDRNLYERALGEALASATAAGVSGRDVTPYLLDAMRQATEGSSIFTNVALLENNVRLGAELARQIKPLLPSR